MNHKATLRVNGKTIGEFDESSDDAVNAQRIKTLLASLNFDYSSPQNAAARQADSYAYAVDLLSETGDWRAIVPLVTNGAFAVELYFKAILINGGDGKSGHSLASLFNSLSDEVRFDAERFYLKSKHAEEPHSTFQQLIENLDGCFVSWRYLHEKKSTNVVSMLSVRTACSVAKELCLRQLSA